MFERAREVGFGAAVTGCKDNCCDALVDVEVVGEVGIPVEKGVSWMSSEVDCTTVMVREMSWNELRIALTLHRRRWSSCNS